jgi:diaphanous 1
VKQEQVKNTIWETIDDTKKKLDAKELEAIFASKPPSSAAGTVNKPAAELKPAKISMLTPERLKSLELILGKLRMSNVTIVESLWRYPVNP